jgi:hypothetical protein
MAIVIEFKIHAPLDKHQNPHNGLFWRKKKKNEKSGYGWEILEALGNFKEKTYLVIHESKSFAPVSKCGISCESKTWEELKTEWSCRQGGDVAGLGGDATKTLGSFGIECFKNRYVDNMKISKDAKIAYGAVVMLRKLATDEKLGFSKRKNDSIDAGEDEDGAWFIGKSILGSSNKALASLVSRKSIVAWIGYMSEPDSLYVQLFCRNEKARQQCREALKSVRKLYPSTALDDEEDFQLTVFQVADPDLIDKEWFSSILRALVESSNLGNRVGRPEKSGAKQQADIDKG